MEAVGPPSHGGAARFLWDRPLMTRRSTARPGYNIVRDVAVLGIQSGHCEVKYENVRVPYDSLLGPRGHGFVIAQERLGPGRIFHCMRWLGQAQRAFDLMCQRLNSRMVRGEPLGRKQLMQKHVFDSYAEIQACRLLTLAAAQKIDKGDRARVEIAAIKVVGAVCGGRHARARAKPCADGP